MVDVSLRTRGDSVYLSVNEYIVEVRVENGDITEIRVRAVLDTEKDAEKIETLKKNGFIAVQEGIITTTLEKRIKVR